MHPRHPPLRNPELRQLRQAEHRALYSAVSEVETIRHGAREARIKEVEEASARASALRRLRRTQGLDNSSIREYEARVDEQLAENNAERRVRLFLSSTFADMTEERRLLSTQTFPGLVEFASHLGVVFSDVDLRWGISSDVAESGQVLLRCLGEVDRCRPFFIGILGERYGWARGADERSDALLDATFDCATREFPWVSEFTDRSITEMEILHGALLHPAAALGGTFFYLRDPDYARIHVPADARDDYRSASVHHQERLRALKTRIVESGLPVRRYRTPSDLANLVFTDIAAQILALYGDATDPSAVDGGDGNADRLSRQMGVLDSLLTDRLRFYCPDTAANEQLHAFLGTQQARPLWITGSPGCGKTAITCHWYQQARDTPDQMTVLYLVQRDDRPIDVLRAIMQQLRDGLAARPSVDNVLANEQVPTLWEHVRAAFGIWADRTAAAVGRLVIAVDGLDDLDVASPGAGDLSWLPARTAPGFWLIVSAATGTDAAAEAGNAPTLTIRPMEPTRRLSLVQTFLAAYGKELDDPTPIVEAQMSGNPLFLRSMLEELRLFGEHDRLTDRIHQLVAAQSLVDLYALIFDRWDQDFGAETVAMVLLLIRHSRRGLTADDIAAIISANIGRTQTTHVLPGLLLSVQKLCGRKRKGRLRFMHASVERAIDTRYHVQRTQSLVAKHTRVLIAKHFEERASAALGRLSAQDLYETPPAVFGDLRNAIVESAYQLRAMDTQDSRADLTRLLGQPIVLQLLSQDDVDTQGGRSGVPLWVSGYLLHALGSMDAVGEAVARLSVVQESGCATQGAVAQSVLVARFLFENGSYGLARATMEALEGNTAARAASESQQLEMAYDMALIAEKEGRYADALVHVAWSLEIIGRTVGPHSREAAQHMALQALLFKKQGEYPLAKATYERALSIMEAHLGPSHMAVMATRQQLGDVLRKMGAWEAARTLYLAVLEAQQNTYGRTHPTVADTCNALGIIAKKKGLYVEALEYLETALAVMHKWYGNTNHPNYATFLVNKADCLRKQDHFALAQETYHEALELLLERVGEQHVDVAEVYAALGLIAKKRTNYDEALALYCIAEETFRNTVGDKHPKYALLLHNTADCYRKVKNIGEAKKRYRAAIQINQERGLDDELGWNWNGLGLLALVEGDLETATLYLEQARLTFLTAFGDQHPKYAQVLNNIGILLKMKGQYSEAIEHYEQALAINKTTFGEQHLECAENLHNAACAWKHLSGREAYRTAKLLQARAVAIVREVVGADAGARVALFRDRFDAVPSPSL